MALTNDQLIALKAEIDDDPNSLGYTSDDPDTAALMNEVRSGAAYELPNVSVGAENILLAVDPDEAGTPSVNQFLLFTSLMSGSVDVSENSELEVSLKAIFAGCPNTLSALGALRNINGSRAEILFGPGVIITHLDVGTARLI